MLLLAPIVRPGFYRSNGYGCWIFLGCTIGLSVALAALAAWRLRPAVLAGGGVRASGRWFTRLVRWQPFVSLDSHPVFWRECRLQQPVRWIGLLWRLYLAGAILFTGIAVYECATMGPQRRAW